MRHLLVHFFLSISFLLLTFNLNAQSNLVAGTVSTSEGPLGLATIVLHDNTDSTIARAAVSNDDGEFTFSKVDTGYYFIRVDYLGMQAYSSAAFYAGDHKVSLPNIGLIASATDLEAVVVKAKAPLIEVLADKTVFNVQNSLVSTGTDALELLRKAPGVILDNNANIILEGRTGVQIYINNKPSVLSGDDLTNYLRTLRSDDIEAIEIITQPSSRYDAAGNAGIINIRLKKDKRMGTNGTFSAGIARGKNTRYNTSLSLNNRTKKTNAFGTYSNSFGETWSFMYLDRIQQGVRYDSETETLSDRASHNVKTGFDFFPNQKNTFGVLFNANFSDGESLGETVTPIIPSQNTEAEQILLAQNQNTNKNYNINSNLNYRYADTTGQELLIDVDYGRYERDRTNYQPNEYVFAENGTPIFERNFRMITPTTIDLFSAKMDYIRNLLGGKIGMGIKYSNVQTSNDFQFFDVENNIDVLNIERSNEFDYTENINAAYINFDKKWKKWNLQLGFRAEQTISEGLLTSSQNNEDDQVKRNYLNLFPSGGLTYNLDYNHSFALRYSRRIQRPNYRSLNPFQSQVDELTFSKGNPFLQPQYTENIKLSHTYKYSLNTSISYSYVKDFFAQITDTIGSTRNFLQTQNIADKKVWNLGVGSPVPVSKWWDIYVSINAFYASYTGTDEKFNAVDQTTFSLYAQHTFTLPASVKLQVSGWFSSPSIWGGTYQTKSMGSLDLAVQKKFLDDRLSVRLSATDVLFTSFWRADMRFGDLYIDGRGGWESQQVRLNISYAFGSNKIKKARNRKTGAESETSRIK